MKWSDQGTEFENAPPGSHLARCYSLIDLGTQVSHWQGKEVRRRKVRISFELPYVKMEGKYRADLKGKPFAVHMQVTQSLDRRAKLRQLLEGWRGKRFEQHELEEYHPKKLLGVPCRLSLVESDTGWINIDSISRVTREEQDAMPALTNAQVYVSLDPDEFNQQAFDALSDVTKEKLQATPEWHALWEAKEDEPGEQLSDEEMRDIPF